MVFSHLALQELTPNSQNYQRTRASLVTPWCGEIPLVIIGLFAEWAVQRLDSDQKAKWAVNRLFLSWGDLKTQTDLDSQCDDFQFKMKKKKNGKSFHANFTVREERMNERNRLNWINRSKISIKMMLQIGSIHFTWIVLRRSKVQLSPIDQNINACNWSWCKSRFVYFRIRFFNFALFHLVFSPVIGSIVI